MTREFTLRFAVSNISSVHQSDGRSHADEASADRPSWVAREADNGGSSDASPRRRVVQIATNRWSSLILAALQRGNAASGALPAYRCRQTVHPLTLRLIGAMALGVNSGPLRVQQLAPRSRVSASNAKILMWLAFARKTCRKLLMVLRWLLRQLA